MWVYLNWALGLRELDCKVVWLEGMNAWTVDEQLRYLGDLKTRLDPYGLADQVSLFSDDGHPVPREVSRNCLELDDVLAETDLLLNLSYGTPESVVGRARRSALIDIDPGLLQTWVSQGDFPIPRHDTFFTTGETVGTPEARFSDLGIQWQYTPPCVSLLWWQPVRTEPPASFTTVSHWASNDWLTNDAGDLVSNEKRAGFLAFLDLPRQTTQTLELALQMRKEKDDVDRALLIEHGWRVKQAWTVAATPWQYQKYIQTSLGEFSCVKPSCVRLQNAWISDRTLCYLASGKPSIVQHTGPSRFLPDNAGLCRFRDLAEAARCLETVSTNYEQHCRLARAIAEEHFDAKKVAGHLLERALP